MHRFRPSPDTGGRPGSARIRRLAPLAALGLLLAGCADNAPQTTLEPAGPAAESIDNLWNLTLAIAVVVFILVEVGALFIIWKFRSRRDDDTLPEQLHGNTKLEIGWTVLPAVVLAFLAVATVATVLDLADEPDDSLQVRVVGQQWWWSYDYDINGNGIHPDSDLLSPGIEHPEEYATDIETANELVIPVGRPVYLSINSRDVIHSYWIPALNGKMDAAPGREHYLTLEADEPGTYVGQCTEFCGLAHAYMHMRVIALPQAEFDAWVENQLAPAREPQASLERDGAEIFVDRCASCHLVRGLNDDTYDGAAQTSGAAPNLTHFASRGTYAGSIFELWTDLDGDGIIQYEEIGQRAEGNQLAAWLRDPAAAKPMYVDGGRGMPNLGLNEAEIDALVAYLLSLD